MKRKPTNQQAPIAYQYINKQSNHLQTPNLPNNFFCFSNGIFSDLLKTSNVILIFKRGENQDYNYYQPISLIFNLSKLMEKIVHPRLYSFLKKSSLLFEQQYGFCNKLSTNHTLIDITSKIQTACEQNDNFLKCVI